MLNRDQLIVSADYWDARNSERLEHGTIEDALEDLFDSLHERGESILECISRVAPVTVNAHVQNEWKQTSQANFAEGLLERLIEDVEQDEEIGADDDGIELTNDQYAACLAKAEELVAELAKYHKPYWCTQIGHVTLEADEIEQILRAHVPAWFEGE